MINIDHFQRTRLRIVGAAVALVSLLFIALQSAYSEQPIKRFGPSRSQQSLKNSFDDINNKTLGFERVIAINLPQRSDHRDAFTLAAALSGFHVDFIDGVNGSSIPVKVLPPDHDPNQTPGTIGSWRAHVNAIREVVANDVASALIMEDDVDWDLRLRNLLQDFAVSSAAVLENSASHALQFEGLSKPNNTVGSPYGDGWDILWLGHCGMDIHKDRSRVLHANDVSVPQIQYLESWDPDAPSPMLAFPNHTRLTGTLSEGVCSLAYAVTQQAARRILYDIGLEHLDMPFDLMLRRFCETATCIGVLPQLFDHHRVKGNKALDSDIDLHTGPDRLVAKTNNIRWSVRLNMKQLLNGLTEYSDQFPDV